MFLGLDTDEFVNDRFVISISANDVLAENGTAWRRVTYLRGSIPRFAFCLSTDAQVLLAATAACSTDD